MTKEALQWGLWLFGAVALYMAVEYLVTGTVSPMFFDPSRYR